MKNALPVLILLAVVLGCGGSRQKTSVPKDDTPRKLSADVSITGKGIKITNTDAADFPSMTLKLNLKDLGGDDGRVDGVSLAKGKTITVPYSEFTVGTQRFNPQHTKIMTVYLKSGDGSAKLFICTSSHCEPA